MPPRTQTNQRTNIVIARAVPVVLLAIIGYASWVLTKYICIDYLLNPPVSSTQRPRHGSATAILVTYYLLLLALLVSYGRLLDTVVRHPGLIPRGPQWYTEKLKRTRSRREARGGRNSRRSEDEKSVDSDTLADTLGSETLTEIRYRASEQLPFKVEDFWQKDVFVCNADGRPAFCSHCHNWKPDRSHHCSELNRCVLKFDHFCPWVGGVVSETSFKFFIQFTFYAALYTLHTLIVSAYFFAERRRRTGFLNVHWIVLLAVAGLFFLFSGGMCVSTAQFAFINSTTIENLNRKTKVWHLAIYARPTVLQEAFDKRVSLQLISYPRPIEEQIGTPQSSPAGGSSGGLQQNPQTPEGAHRTFAILASEPGDNPFDLGSLRNFQDIMGDTIWEWLSPLKPSPCLKHDESTSLYKLGRVVDEMKSMTGLSSWQSRSARHPARRKTRSRRERPAHDGPEARSGAFTS